MDKSSEKDANDAFEQRRTAIPWFISCVQGFQKAFCHCDQSTWQKKLKIKLLPWLLVSERSVMVVWFHVFCRRSWQCQTVIQPDFHFLWTGDSEGAKNYSESPTFSSWSHPSKVSSFHQPEIKAVSVSLWEAIDIQIITKRYSVFIYKVYLLTKSKFSVTQCEWVCCRKVRSREHTRKITEEISAINLYRKPTTQVFWRLKSIRVKQSSKQLSLF